MPMHELYARADRHQARGEDTGPAISGCRKGGGGMSVSDRIPKQIEDALLTNRRGFLKSAGLLAVSFGVFGSATIAAGGQSGAATQGAGPYHDPDYHQIDSW